MKEILFNNFDKENLGRLQEHYSIKTISQNYDLSENTIRKWIRRGKLKAHKINGAVRIPKSELLRIVSDWTDYK